MNIDFDAVGSSLRLHKVFVSNIDFTTDEVLLTSECNQNKEKKLQCSFSCSIRAGKSNSIIAIGVSIKPDDKAYKLKVEVTGIFTIDGEAEESSQISSSDLLTQNAVAIIFPYLRAHIASISHMSGIGEINIPVFNIAAALTKARVKEVENTATE